MRPLGVAVPAGLLGDAEQRFDADALPCGEPVAALHAVVIQRPMNHDVPAFSLRSSGPSGSTTVPAARQWLP